MKTSRPFEPDCYPGRHDLLAGPEEIDLARRLRSTDGTDLERRERQRVARDRLVECNIRLVKSIAKKYAGKGLDRDDLIQHGIVGLIQGVNRFDPDRGFRLSTYVSHYIRLAIKVALRDEVPVIRVPAYLREAMDKAAKGKPLRRKARKDEKDNLHEHMRQADRALRLRATGPAKYLGSHVEYDGMEYVPSPERPDEETDSASDLELLAPLVEQLDDREREIIRLRFGLGGVAPATFRAIGETMEISWERARQIETGAIVRLRKEAGQLAGLMGREAS